MKLVNTTHDTEPLILHASGPLELSPLWQPLNESFFGQEHIDQAVNSGEYTFFTWDSGGDHAYVRKELGTVQRCLGRMGLSCEVLGHGVSPWRNILKIQTLEAQLQQTDSPYVIATDSPDILVLRNPQEAVDKFKRYGCSLLYIADSSFWPPEFSEIKKAEEAVAGAAESSFPYLNSGALVGETEFVREFFARALVLAQPQMNIPHKPGSTGAGSDSDDQSIIKRLYLEYYPDVQIDFTCDIFQTLTLQDESVLNIE